MRNKSPIQFDKQNYAKANPGPVELDQLSRRCSYHRNRHSLAASFSRFICATADGAIIHAPSSTKNREGKREPEMHQTKKGNQWYFGMKAHIGVDADSGLVHTVTSTAANVADVTQAEHLLHGKEELMHGDAGFTGVERRIKRKLKYSIAEKRSKQKQLPEGPAQAAWRELERRKAQVRAKVEHPFRVIKRQFGYVKARFKGLAKNHGQLLTLFALSNLWMARRKLMHLQGSCA